MFVPFRVIEREPTVTVELEWSRPTQTYGELQGYRLRYGVKDQTLKEVVLQGKNKLFDKTPYLQKL